MTRRYWECECCTLLIVTLPQDSAVDYPCPQCANVKCAHGGRFKELTKAEFVCEAECSAPAPSTGLAWQPIKTAPKNGTMFWGWLGERGMTTGIQKCFWMTAKEVAQREGGSECDYEAGFVTSADLDENIYPTFWLPLKAIPSPLPATQGGA